MTGPGSGQGPPLDGGTPQPGMGYPLVRLGWGYTMMAYSPARDGVPPRQVRMGYPQARDGVPLASDGVPLWPGQDGGYPMMGVPLWPGMGYPPPGQDGGYPLPGIGQQMEYLIRRSLLIILFYSNISHLYSVDRPGIVVFGDG